MASLYELANDYTELMELEGQVDEEQLNQIKELVENEIKNKSGNIVKLIMNIQSDVKAIDEEIKRLNKKKKAKNNTIDSIKEYTKNHLLAMEMKKVETPFGNITVRNNPASLKISDETLIPMEYIEEEIVKNVNKSAIKDLLKDGKEIPGCELTYSKSLIIN